MKFLLSCLFLSLTVFTSAGQVTYNGNMSEAHWGEPLATSAGGPASCLGAALALNSLYASANDNDLEIGISGDVTAGHRILVFIDCKPGGYANGDFGRTNAPHGIDDFNKNTVFDDGFLPDYCLVIGSNNSHDQFSFELFELAGNVSSGGGTNTSFGLAGRSNPFLTTAYKLSANPNVNDFTMGFEMALAKTLLHYDAIQQPILKLMAMSVTDDGNLNNQFLSKAKTGESCYGKAAIDFNHFAPGPVAYNPSQTLPIDFLNVYAVKIGQNIKVFWRSVTEKDMLQYLVERSGDAVNFTAIDTVKAFGNATAITDYNTIDAQPLAGKNFYRIKAIDKTGRSTYSSIIKLSYGWIDNTLVIYPNPVKDVINLQIIGIRPGDYQLDVYNDLGQALISKKIVYSGGYGSQVIPLPRNLRKGPYRLLLRNKALFYKQQFLVQ